MMKDQKDPVTWILAAKTENKDIFLTTIGMRIKTSFKDEKVIWLYNKFVLYETKIVPIFVQINILFQFSYKML